MTNLLFGSGQTAFVNGERVKQARELIGITQSDLARRVGVTQAMIAHIEGGFKQPSKEVLNAIAVTTSLPTSFFRQDQPPDLPAGSLLFRARAGASRRKLQTAHRYAQVVLELAIGLAARVRTIPMKLRTGDDSPEEAAKSTRRDLGLPAAQPVPHLIRAIEKAGGIVLALPQSEQVDAFAVWAGRLPILAIAEHAAGDRARLTVAHELGHLIMHRASTTDAEIEREAYQFAAELLMPRSTIERDFARVGATLVAIAQLKLRWGVSMQALIRRARDINFIADRQYHYLMQQMSARGWRIKEPANLQITPEKPRLLRRMAELVYGDPIDYAKLSKDFNLRVEFAANLLAKYATADEVGGIGKGQSAKVIKFQKR
jgi:Zn-dependent peptidase ImmA (M78 family)/DNA-binding XRE family transcriptional regulator